MEKDTSFRTCRFETGCLDQTGFFPSFLIHRSTDLFLKSGLGLKEITGILFSGSINGMASAYISRVITLLHHPHLDESPSLDWLGSWFRGQTRLNPNPLVWIYFYYLLLYSLTRISGRTSIPFSLPSPSCSHRSRVLHRTGRSVNGLSHFQSQSKDPRSLRSGGKPNLNRRFVFVLERLLARV
jgi:hypothetical protein